MRSFADIAKRHEYDVLPNECTTWFPVGAKIPSRRIGDFCSPPRIEWCIHWAKPHTHVVLFLYHSFCENIGIFGNLTVLDKGKLSLRMLQLAEPNSSLWWRHNVYSWRHNGVCLHTRGQVLWTFHPFKQYPNHLCILIQDSHVFLSGKTMWDWLDRYFWNCGI